MKRKRTPPSAPDQSVPLDAVTGGVADVGPSLLGFAWNEGPGIESAPSFDDDGFGVSVSVTAGGSPLKISMG